MITEQRLLSLDLFGLIHIQHGQSLGQCPHHTVEIGMCSHCASKTDVPDSHSGKQVILDKIFEWMLFYALHSVRFCPSPYVLHQKNLK